MNRYETISLRDGSLATIRLLRPADAGRLLAMHQRLSADTIYNRYLSPRTPTMEELEQICRLNEVGGGALVVTAGSQIVGLAYYISPDGRSAEPAILIEDRFQRRGLGRKLFMQLVQHARERGISNMVALIYGTNHAVMQLIKGTGLPYQTSFSYGTREVQMQLAPLAHKKAERETAAPNRNLVYAGRAPAALVAV